jgi:hypothetical protein
VTPTQIIASAGLKRRQVAEALFAKNPLVNEFSTDLPAPLSRTELVDAATSELAPREIIPATHIARIRTWVKYGMTIPQVAAIEGVLRRKA